MGKAADAIANTLNVEVKMARAAHDLRKAGSDIGKTVHIGRTLIG